ncbi:MAG: hypothetical protein M0R03_16640 [Novosphingobium sp.]|nr:hypothetical protein [Novosphingobium sp.]
MKKLIILLSFLNLAITPIYCMQMDNIDRLKSIDSRELPILATLKPWQILNIAEHNQNQSVIYNAYNNLLNICNNQRNYASSDDKTDYNTISKYIKLAYDNIINKKKIRIDRYDILKRLFEAYLKKESERNPYDKTLLNIFPGIRDLDINNPGSFADFTEINNARLIEQSEMVNYIKLISEYFIDSDYKKNLFINIIQISNELYRISALGSTDPLHIKKAAKRGKIFHIFSAVSGSMKLCLKIIEIIIMEEYIPILEYFNIEINSYGKTKRLITSLDTLPGLSAFKFIGQDREIQNNAKKIAKYNKETNRDLRQTKLKQYAWLAVNKLAPSLLSTFTNNNDNRYVFELFSNVSEIARKHYRYKAEMGDYKNYCNIK